MKKATIVILGLGNRGMTYAQFAAEKLESVEIVAVAEPKREQVDRLLSDKNLKGVKVFNSADELFAHPKLADGIVIATQDRQHVGHAMAALEKGYDILL